MKTQILQNGFKLMMGLSALILSVSFLMRSIMPAQASQGNSKIMMVPVNADGSITVKLSDEQLGKIIPKNADGSINVRLAPNAITDVNVKQIDGKQIATITSYSTGKAGFLVGTCSGTIGCN